MKINGKFAIIGLLSCFVTMGVQANTVNNDYKYRVYGGYNIYQEFDDALSVGFEQKVYDFKNNKTKLLYSLEYVSAKFKDKPLNNYSSKNNWFSVSPTIQHYVSNDLYLKAGVGVAYKENTKFGKRRSGSNWEFALGAAVGYELSKDWNVEMRWRHYSNADTAMPNPGRDFLSIDVGYKF